MAGYLLNLIYAKPTAATAATGLFVDDDPNAPERSKVWYTMGAGWPASIPAQDGQVMEVANLPSKVPPAPIPDSPPSGLPLFTCSLDDDIYVRLAANGTWGRLWPMWPDGLKMSLDYSSVFGRAATSDRGGATMSSPFVFLQSSRGAGTNSPRSVFSLLSNTPGPDGSFIFYLGRLAQNVVGQKGLGGPRDPNRGCAYSFNVGGNAYFNENGVNNQYAYGHDPKVIVKG
jgi:hypothetical protein